MASIVKCPSCQSALRIKEEYAGKQLKCPRCAHVIQVPGGPAAEDEEAPSEAMRSPRRSAPPPRREEALAEDEPPPRRAGRKRPRDEEEDEEEDRPVKRRADKNRAEYAPCPRCGGTDAKKVLWTPWGSFYGPAMFHHVRCRDCRYAYNGRSGNSNLIPAIIFVTIPSLLIGGILVFVALLLINRLTPR